MTAAVFGRFRYASQVLIDSCAWLLAVFVATYLRFEMDLSSVDLGGVLRTAAVAAVLQVAIGTAAGLYLHRWRYGTFEEVAATARVATAVTAIVTLANISPLLDHSVPVSASIVAGFLALAAMCGVRMTWRLLLDRWTRATHSDREPVIVMGAGEGGLQTVTAMVKSGPYHPVALLDDDTKLRNLRIKGVRVRGTRKDLAHVVDATGASTLVIAIPSADAETIRDLAARADQLDLKTLILPSVDELFGASPGIGDIRPLTEADLLGRRELSLDTESVAHYLTGKTVLVTGAGGSIGSELCRQIHRYEPGSLVMLERDESALQSVQVSIEGNGLLDNRNLVICDIRDRKRLAEVFDEHRPDVVFHAAALKHLPLLEMHGEEGWKTNVWGTQNLLELAVKHDVDRFVNVSTDKAADATSVLGRTKRVAEQLTSFTGKHNSGTYLSVRFGNVLGSRGSVLPLFREQIERGGPVTVTDPEVTRFFMTIPEACELVVQAGTLDGEDGRVLVLDMGEPVKIADLAHRLVAESGKDVEIIYTGLRPGEKLHEVLFSPDEQPTASGHPLISSVRVPSMSPAEARVADPFRNEEVIDLRDSVDVSFAHEGARRSIA